MNDNDVLDHDQVHGVMVVDLGEPVKPFISDKPLTDEQVWGVPKTPKVVEEQTNICVHKKIPCSAWDNGCRVERCVVGFNF